MLKIRVNHNILTVMKSIEIKAGNSNTWPVVCNRLKRQ